MATTTAQIQISSPDLTGDTINISKQTTVNKAGLSTGLDQTSGIGKKITTSTSQYTLFKQTDYTDDKAHKVYLRVPSTNATEYATVTIGSQEVGRLYGGDFMFFPWAGTDDLRITPSVSTAFALEYFLIFEV